MGMDRGQCTLRPGSSKPDPKERTQDGLVPPSRRRVGGEDHVEDVQIGILPEPEGQPGRDCTVLCPLVFVEVNDPLVVGEDPGQRTQGLAKRVSELDPVAGAVGGEGFSFIPAPLHAIPELNRKLGSQPEVRIQFQFGSPLRGAFFRPDVLDAQHRLAGGDVEPRQEFVLEAGTDDLDVGPVLGIEAIAGEEPRLCPVCTPELNGGPCPPFVGAESPRREEAGEEENPDAKAAPGHGILVSADDPSGEEVSFGCLPWASASQPNR